MDALQAQLQEALATLDSVKETARKDQLARSEAEVAERSALGKLKDAKKTADDLNKFKVCPPLSVRIWKGVERFGRMSRSNGLCC